MHNGSNNEQITRLTVSCYHKTFCGRSMAVPSTEPDGCMVFVILSPGAPEGSTSSDSQWSITSQKTSQQFKSHPTDCESRESNSGPLCTWQLTYS